MPVMHHVPGRLRIHLSGVKGNPAKAHSIAREIGVLPGVTGAESNILTGSVVVRYDPSATDVDSVLAALALDSSAVSLPLPQRDRYNLRETLAEETASAVLGIFIEKALERSIPMFLAALL